MNMIYLLSNKDIKTWTVRTVWTVFVIEKMYPSHQMHWSHLLYPLAFQLFFFFCSGSLWQPIEPLKKKLWNLTHRQNSVFFFFSANFQQKKQKKNILFLTPPIGHCSDFQENWTRSSSDQCRQRYGNWLVKPFANNMQTNLMKSMPKCTYSVGIKDWIFIHFSYIYIYIT